ncbi:MAG: DUF3500 domain-containing protein [Planctomycetes bacterium]|nr:DUF3500 domain-containing protein [Planctomycetota bacterium]
MKLNTSCSDGSDQRPALSRREFGQIVGAAAVAATLHGANPARLPAQAKPAATSESLVKQLYDSLTPGQKEEVCFAWDYQDDRGLLRTHVSNNWNITDLSKLSVAGDFYTKDQQALIRQIFTGLYNPEWHDRIFKQLKDDTDGAPFGKEQSIAIFGKPGSGQFEFVMTGRHLTIRCDGDSTDHVAFGGPIFYGHAAAGFNEPVGHPGNVFWPQAQQANKLYQMLSGKQREQALVAVAPQESKVEFKGKTGAIAGLPISELSADQKDHAKGVLKALLDPYREADRTEAVKMLDAQGGLDACRLAFYRKAADGTSLDLGDDGEWDVWRIEGPSFVWHFRGVPHVHVWVNVADDASLKLNAKG